METAKIQEGAALYYLTFTVVYRLPVFVSAEPCLIFTESLNYCHRHKGLPINAFVIMPTHTHLIVFDADFDNERLNKTITAMRQYTGRQPADCHEKMPAVCGQVRCQITPVNVPVIYTHHYEPPIYTQDVPPYFHLW